VTTIAVTHEQVAVLDHLLSVMRECAYQEDGDFDYTVADLAALDDAAYTADVDKKKALALVDDAANKIT